MAYSISVRESLSMAVPGSKSVCARQGAPAPIAPTGLWQTPEAAKRTQEVIENK